MYKLQLKSFYVQNLTEETEAPIFVIFSHIITLKMRFSVSQYEWICMRYFVLYVQYVHSQNNRYFLTADFQLLSIFFTYCNLSFE